MNKSEIDEASKEATESTSMLPRCGIFDPTKPIKYGVDLNDLKANSDKGAVLEFCTEDLDVNINDATLLQNKYFDSPDMMKCSYLLEELTTAADEDDSVPAFERMRAKMTHVTDDGGVGKALLCEGVGVVVPADSCVRVHYHAYLEHMSEPYDSSYLQGKELRITLGKGQVVPGLDMGIATMRKCEKARFLVGPEYAYGVMGCPPRIPSNTTILFEVELLGYTESSILDECAEEDRGSMAFEKLLVVAKAEKNEGNDLFQQCQYAKAQRKFMRCINALEFARLKNAKEEAEMIKVVSKSYQNMALCALRLGNFGKSLASGKRVLEHDPNHPKALYIVGKSLRHIGNFAEARKFMLRARTFAPSSRDVTKELKLIDRAEEQFRRAEIDMCKKMFSDSSEVQQPKSTRAEVNPVYGHEATVAFREIIKGRLDQFMKEEGFKELGVPISTFTQREIYCAADAAEEMGFDVDLVDQPGKTKQLKIIKKF